MAQPRCGTAPDMCLLNKRSCSFWWFVFSVHQRLRRELAFPGKQAQSPGSWVGRRALGFIQGAGALAPDRSAVATCLSHLSFFLPGAGHGMDSRPAMAIFELLDYIVNEVRACPEPHWQVSTPMKLSHFCWRWLTKKKRIQHADCGFCWGGAAGGDGDVFSRMFSGVKICGLTSSHTTQTSPP